jgi:hypothetical protein
MKTLNASTTAIVALDLGKYKSVACLYDGDPAAARFQSLTTCRAARFRRLEAAAAATERRRGTPPSVVASS